MNSNIESDPQQKARELARQITVAHDLDPEIQEELYGHIEDKLLAYKSGEERISDEDAFILVREHLGDAKVLASMFAEVHEEAASLTPGALDRRGVGNRSGTFQSEPRVCRACGRWVSLPG